MTKLSSFYFYILYIGCLEFCTKNSFWYIILPTVTLRSILISLYYNNDILCLIIVLSCNFGIYNKFTLMRLIKFRKFSLQSNEVPIAAFWFSFMLLAPFFYLEQESNEQLSQITQSEHFEQKNVQ